MLMTASVIPSFRRRLLTCTSAVYHFLLFHVNPFWLHLSYFTSLSLLGFLLLLALPMKTTNNSSSPTITVPKYPLLDLFFTSVSATTVSSMSTIPMESFSDSQLTLLTLLMFLGGEVFTSMLALFLPNYLTTTTTTNIVDIIAPSPEIELGSTLHVITNPATDQLDQTQICNTNYCSKSLNNKYLAYVVLGYLLLVQATGYALILVYFSLFPTQKSVLELKGIRLHTFALFTAVSSFTNCGFVPTNENMTAFRTGSGLLLTVCGLVLLGNTLFPLFLRLALRALKRLTPRREESEFILSRAGSEELGYDHLLGEPESVMLGVTVGALFLVQLILFCWMEWGSLIMDGMSSYQKGVGAVFMSVNSRHAGESIVDLAAVHPAILVLYILMMYLPPYTSFLPQDRDDTDDGMISSAWIKDMSHHRIKKKKKKRSKGIMDKLLFSPLSYLAIYVIVICITERRHLVEDPLNFSVLNIAFEVMSAYGNVGFSTGYSCSRQVKPDGKCRDSWSGFSGRWSRGGKLTLILVMFFGRLKKFSNAGGQAWKLG